MRLTNFLPPAPPAGDSPLALACLRVAFALVILVRTFLTLSPATFLSHPAALAYPALSLLSAGWLLTGVGARSACLLGSLVSFGAFYGESLREIFGASSPGAVTRSWGVPMVLYFLGTMLLLLAFTPCGERLSLRSRPRNPSPDLSMVPLLRLQVCAVYFWAALAKLRGEYWNGTVLETLWLKLGAGSLGWYHDEARMSTFAALARLSFLAELLLCCLLWFPRSRRAGMALGVAFHLATAALLPVGGFAATILATYLLFADSERLEGAWGSRQAR